MRVEARMPRLKWYILSQSFLEDDKCFLCESFLQASQFTYWNLCTRREWHFPRFLFSMISHVDTMTHEPSLYLAWGLASHLNENVSITYSSSIIDIFRAGSTWLQARRPRRTQKSLTISRDAKTFWFGPFWCWCSACSQKHAMYSIYLLFIHAAVLQTKARFEHIKRPSDFYYTDRCRCSEM
jgi:hypothetical protein